MPKYTKPRGVEDVLPSEMREWHIAERNAREAARLFGYEEIRFPTFEHTELFKRANGETTDVVTKEMYTFEDKGGRSLTLRPEGTASVVRAFVENALHLQGLPLKVYYIAPNFRYEKPQAGRLREHHQFGAECFGSEHPSADAELIALASHYLKSNGVNKTVLHLNTIGCPECRGKYNLLLREYFEARREALCDTCKERLERNPLRILDCKNASCNELKADAPKPSDHLCGGCADHFEAVGAELEALGVPFIHDTLLVRGFDYYTRTVFEFISSDIGAQGAVLAGGRYDRLVAELGGVSTPALGFGSGIERLLLQRKAEGVIDADIRPSAITLIAADDAQRPFVTALAQELRRMGIAAGADIMQRSVKAQMKYADKSGATHTAVIGGDERVSGTVKVRNLATHDEVSLELSAEGIGECLRPRATKEG